MRGFSKDKNVSTHNSLQIWYEGNDSNAKLQLDVNMWRLKNRFSREIFWDFGIKIFDPELVKRIYIFSFYY